MNAEISRRASESLALFNAIGSAVGPLANKENAASSIAWVKDQEYFANNA